MVERGPEVLTGRQGSAESMPICRELRELSE